MRWSPWSVQLLECALSPARVATDVVNILYPTSTKASRSKFWANIPSEWKGLTKVMTLGGMLEWFTLRKGWEGFCLGIAGSDRNFTFVLTFKILPSNPIPCKTLSEFSPLFKSCPNHCLQDYLCFIGDIMRLFYVSYLWLTYGKGWS